MHKISAVIPYFNDHDFIEECLVSLHVQNQALDEIIIVNDGSSVESSEALNRIAEKYNATVLKQNNSGPAVARNLGFSIAKGTYVLMVDADDKIHANFIKEAYEKLKLNEKIGAVSSWAQEFGNSHTLRKYEGGNEFFRFLIKNRAVSCALINKNTFNAVGGYDVEQAKLGQEDWGLWLDFIKLGYGIYVLPKPYFFYRIKNKTRNAQSVKRQGIIEDYLIAKHKVFISENLAEYHRFVKSYFNAQKEDIYQSKTYKIGEVLMKPIKKLKSLFK